MKKAAFSEISQFVRVSNIFDLHYMVDSVKKPAKTAGKFCADFLLRAVLYLHKIHPSTRDGRFERSGSRKEDEFE
mgnify:CR=1 FL=1